MCHHGKNIKHNRNNDVACQSPARGSHRPVLHARGASAKGHAKNQEPFLTRNAAIPVSNAGGPARCGPRGPQQTCLGRVLQVKSEKEPNTACGGNPVARRCAAGRRALAPITSGKDCLFFENLKPPPALRTGGNSVRVISPVERNRRRLTNALSRRPSLLPASAANRRNREASCAPPIASRATNPKITGAMCIIARIPKTTPYPLVAAAAADLRYFCPH